jgi:hypothetical protein
MLGLLYGRAESIDRFIESQAFLRSLYDPTPRPPPSLSNKLSLFLSLPVCRPSSLLTGEVGGGRGAKSYEPRKHGHPIFSNGRRSVTVSTKFEILFVVTVIMTDNSSWA